MQDGIQDARCLFVAPLARFSKEVTSSVDQGIKCLMHTSAPVLCGEGHKAWATIRVNVLLMSMHIMSPPRGIPYTLCTRAFLLLTTAEDQTMEA